MTDNLKGYFKFRKVIDLTFLDFMLSKRIHQTEFKLFTVNGQDYMMSYFLDASDNIGRGLIITNDILKTANTDMLVFAVVEGDDVICLNVIDNSIWLWCLESDNGEFVKVAKSFDVFLKTILD